MTPLFLLACGSPDHPRSSEACGGCHPAELEAWEATGHARSGVGEVFVAWLPEVRAAWGEGAERRCVACHAPGFGGEEEEGVGCLACHGAVGNRGEADGALVVDERGPIGTVGPVPDAPHELVGRELLASASLCATCHEVTGPELVDERTGSEHAASGEERTCADCHLPDGDHDLRPRWEGALELRLGVDGGEVAVEVENVGAGHDVPTGVAFLRELVVELEVHHEDGEVVRRRVFDLAPVPVRAGRPVPLLTDADAIDGAALARGELRSAREPLGDDVVEVRATATFRRFRPEALDALGLPADTGGPPEVVASAWLRP